MSRATKRKHVIREVHEEQLRPPTAEQSIVKVIAGRGNNLHLVSPPSGEPFLASMPTKFRRNLWIKRGDYLLVEPIAEGDKVKAEIVLIITRDHKRYFHELGIWPAEFDETVDVNQTMQEAGDTHSDEDEGIFVNTNRQQVEMTDSDESSEDTENSEGSEESGEQEIDSVSDKCDGSVDDKDSGDEHSNSVLVSVKDSETSVCH